MRTREQSLRGSVRGFDAAFTSAAGALLAFGFAEDFGQESLERPMGVELNSFLDAFLAARCCDARRAGELFFRAPDFACWFDCLF
jgi:hypothetical protein